MEKKLKKMAEGLCEVLDDVGLISFIAMNIQDGEVRPITFSPLPHIPLSVDCQSGPRSCGSSKWFQFFGL